MLQGDQKVAQGDGHDDDISTPYRRESTNSGPRFDGVADGRSTSSKEVEYPPMRWVHLGPVSCNPVTSVLSFVVLWALAIWCIVDPDGAYDELSEGKTMITVKFTWFYVLTTPVWVIFLIVIYFKFGNQKLGKKGEQPEFSSSEYFALVFSAGVAVGLFYYGVSEPLYHRSRFGVDGSNTEDEVDMLSLNQTVFHWGISAWAPYVLVAICAGIASYKHDLPLTIRSCFHMLLGAHTFGWIGDLLDAFSIITVVTGVCTSLGLGSIQIIQGFQRVGWLSSDLDDDQLTTARMVAIAIVTFMATASVVSGLDYGIKTLSQIALVLGLALWFLVLAFDKTAFLFNLFVQEIGVYFATEVEMNFQTDAFAQLTPGEGRSLDGQSVAAGWMNGWLIFYWGWWTAWSSFVGMFIARVSRGRTIREVIHYTIAGPLLYTFAWFSVFGGAGLRMTRRAAELVELGNVTHGDPNYYNINGTTCYEVPADSDEANISPVCLFDPNNPDAAWFDVLYQYYDYGAFLSVLSLIAIAFYFVTSSDSGSLIVDTIASNGSHDHHWSQRVFWALTEGALAMALLYAGGTSALQALQAGSIIAGLPFTIMLCLMMINLWMLLEDGAKEEKNQYVPSRSFIMPLFGGVFDFVETVVSCKVNHERREFTKAPETIEISTFFVAFVAPGYVLFNIRELMFPKQNNLPSHIAMAATVTILFLGWVILWFAAIAEPGLFGYAWLCYITFTLLLAAARMKCRKRFNIRGNLFLDCLAALIYPQILTQMFVQLKLANDDHLDEDGNIDQDDDEEDEPEQMQKSVV